MKSYILFMFKNLKKKSNEIIFYLKLYIIGVGQDKVIPEPTLNPSRVFNNFLNSPQTCLYLSKILPIRGEVGQVLEKKSRFFLPSFEKKMYGCIGTYACYFWIGLVV